MKTYKNFEEDFEKAKANMELLESIETHGKIVVRFNKGEFKKYMAMCEEMYKALAIKANASKYISLVDNIKDFIKPNIDLKNS